MDSGQLMNEVTILLTKTISEEDLVRRIVVARQNGPVRA